MRGATRPDRDIDTVLPISIHAPHAGRDKLGFPKLPQTIYFNPRAPCGARPALARRKADREPFQSTRPMRGATYTNPNREEATKHFNPRAPCGARPPAGAISSSAGYFNPRAP